MGQPETFNVPYQLYLHTHMWPSDSERDHLGHPKLIDVRTMPSNRAASSLAKLLRWCRVAPAGDITLIHEVDARENHVRDLPLAQALSARALSLPDIGSLYALFHQAGDLPSSEPAEAKALLVLIFDALKRVNPLANSADLGNSIAAVLGDLLDNYDITRRAD